MQSGGVGAGGAGGVGGDGAGAGTKIVAATVVAKAVTVAVGGSRAVAWVSRSNRAPAATVAVAE